LGTPRYRLTAAFLLLALGSWGVTAWVARDASERAIELTNRLFAVDLGITYLAAWALAAIWARAPRRVLFRAVTATLVLLVSDAILEIPALFGLVDYPFLWARITSGEGGRVGALFVADPDLAFRRPPHLRASFEMWGDVSQNWNVPVSSPNLTTFSTDARGFRNQRDLDRADIVLIGDSFIEGDGVSDGETCSAVAERLIGRPVANLGVAGYGPRQESRVLEQHALPLRPRMVAWFFFEGNDFLDDWLFEEVWSKGIAYGSWGRGYFDWGNFQKRSIAITAFSAARRLFHPLVPNGVPHFGWFRDERGQLRQISYHGYYDVREESAFLNPATVERWEKTKEIFRRGKEECEKRGAKLVVFFVPLKFRVYGDYSTYPEGNPCRNWKLWELPARFTRFCEEEQIECVDLSVPMRRAAAAGKLLYIPDDSHWSREGHKLVAELVREQWDRCCEAANGK
jgi:hypothetical protein